MMAREVGEYCSAMTGPAKDPTIPMAGKLKSCMRM